MKNKYPVSIFQLASEFLAKEPMTELKLQQLCYYAEGWYCAFYTSPLTGESISAISSGMMFSKLHQICKKYVDTNISSNNFKPYKTISPRKANEKRLVKMVWRTYGNLTEAELSILVRQELPWQSARNCGGNSVSKAVMQKYFASQISANEQL